MSYIINKSNGSVVTTIADGTVDLTSTSIGLIGRNYPGYGEIINEDLVKILENFSNNTAPASPLKGQLWYDATDESIKVNISDNPNSPEWVLSGKAFVGSVTPPASVTGSIWYDDHSKKFSVKTANSWDALKTYKVFDIDGDFNNPGGSSSNEFGDLLYATDENVFLVYTNGPKTGIPGWDQVGVRYVYGSGGDYNFTPNGVKNGDLWFDAQTGQLKMFNEQIDSGLAAGSDVVGPMFSRGSITGVSGHFGVIYRTYPIIVEMLNGVAISVTSPARINNTGFNPDEVNGPFNLEMFGSVLHKGINLPKSNTPGDPFSIPSFAGPVVSNNADLAERYESDMEVEAGDLVRIGGSAEVTKTKSSLDTSVFGVVSSNPGLMLNEGIGDGNLFPFIALAGRVPVKVIGPVQKGQRLVSSAVPGVAVAIDDSQISSAYVAVFGRALETDMSSDIKLIEAVVGSK